jgi:cation diffusion facilitator CzcD-associated flavoprotein CzcO
MTDVDVLIIGAGQAGLSVAYWLRRYGIDSVAIIDADAGPGGAWQHRWPSLKLSKAHGIKDLPGMALGPQDPDRPSAEVVAQYFGAYESEFGLNVRRPVSARSVTRDGDRLRVRTTGADAEPSDEWTARYVVSATGTWSRPFVPHYPGQESFSGRQLRTVDFRDASDFAGQRVLVVGGGASAVQLLAEISEVAQTAWTSRREPVWKVAEFTEELGRDIIAKVDAHTRAGGAPTSVVSNTGLFLTGLTQDAYDRGVYDWRPMFARMVPDGVIWQDGTHQAFDAILWATGFRPAVDHLAPLHLRTPEGGIRVADGRALDEPRLFLAGYGPAASTIGANRGGRIVARQIRAALQPDPRPGGGAHIPTTAVGNSRV